MRVYTFTKPNELNEYQLFDDELENDPLTLFHTTPIENLKPILDAGFAAKKGLDSVSYAKKSSSCLAHRGAPVNVDHAVLVVKFESTNVMGIRNNSSDIHVFDNKIQPIIMGYCIVPKDYVFR